MVTNGKTPADTRSPEGSVGRLLLKHENSIRRFISRRSGPQVLKRTTLDDLYQQTVAAAMASAGSFVFRGDASFISWIHTIVRRVIHKMLDQRSRKPLVMRIKGAQSTGVGVAESELGDGGRTPSSMVARNERETNLRSAIKALPDHYQRVITLYKLEQRPLAEVAKAMGRTKGATCRLMARAIEQLRSHLVEP